MIERDTNPGDEDYPWPINPSRNKFAPWLHVHMRRVLGEGDSTATATVTATATASSSLVNTYDAYLLGDNGGPVVDFWWKMHQDFSASANLVNYGQGSNGGSATGTLVARGVVSSLTPAQASLVDTTYDNASVFAGGADFIWFNANTVRVDGTQNFSAGGWFNVPSVTGGQLLFRSNMGGTQGYWRGLELYHPQAGTYLQIVLGTDSIVDSKFYYRYRSPLDSFPINYTHFVVLNVTPTYDPLTIGLQLFIDGIEQSLSFAEGTGEVIAWPVTDSVPNSYNGIAYSAAGDTYGGRMEGYYDELFFHWGHWTQEQVTEAYARGTQTP
jgi:hypothetical protein